MTVTATPRRRHALLAVTLGLGLGGVVLASVVSCGPPPEGWQGAGRRYDLPQVVPAAEGGPPEAGPDTNPPPPPMDGSAG